MPSDAAGWAVAEMKRLLTSRRMSERDAVQAACRRASAMKTAAGALASLASSSDGIPASLVKYVAELTTTDMSIDSGIISRCRTWLTTNKHELMKCKTPLAMIASAAPYHYGSDFGIPVVRSFQGPLGQTHTHMPRKGVRGRRTHRWIYVRDIATI